MSRVTKKARLIKDQLDSNATYAALDAIAILKKFASSKFDESVEIAFNLGVNAQKPDQNIRSSTILRNGTGKRVRVAVFAQGENAKLALEAGADRVGFQDLADAIKAGELDYDVVIATPDAMPLVGQLGQILGPRGLMPNPKIGTVTMNVAAAVSNAKSGQVRYRTDKNGILHCAVGKLSFKAEALLENIVDLMNDLRKLKPTAAKGVYFKKVTLSSTMGPGLTLDIGTIVV